MKNNYWKENYSDLVQTIEEEKEMTIRNINIDYSQDHLTTKEYEKLTKRAEEKAETELAELNKLAQIEEETKMANKYIEESYLNFVQSLMEDEKVEVLEKINLRREAIIEWDRNKQQLGEWTEELEKESKEKLEHLNNMEKEVKKMAQNEEEKDMDWKEFANLEEVQVDQSPSGTGNALFYNDENIVVSVDIDGDHDEATLWEDEELIQELQELVKVGYDDIYSSISPLSKLGKEVS